MAVNEMHQRIWQVLGQIPQGKVVTYGQVAELAGLAGKSRMVGRCLGQLPEGSRLPWHRVINAQGKISLPVGSEGYDRQVGRLQEEGVVVLNGRVKLSEFRWQP